MHCGRSQLKYSCLTLFNLWLDLRWKLRGYSVLPFSSNLHQDLSFPLNFLRSYARWLKPTNWRVHVRRIYIHKIMSSFNITASGMSKVSECHAKLHHTSCPSSSLITARQFAIEIKVAVKVTRGALVTTSAKNFTFDFENQLYNFSRRMEASSTWLYSTWIVKSHTSSAKMHSLLATSGSGLRLNSDNIFVIVFDAELNDFTS